jgi:hypothetical protein
LDNWVSINRLGSGVKTGASCDRAISYAAGDNIRWLLRDVARLGLGSSFFALFAVPSLMRQLDCEAPFGY